MESRVHGLDSIHHSFFIVNFNHTGVEGQDGHRSSCTPVEAMVVERSVEAVVVMAIIMEVMVHMCIIRI